MGGCEAAHYCVSLSETRTSLRQNTNNLHSFTRNLMMRHQERKEQGERDSGAKERVESLGGKVGGFTHPSPQIELDI